MRWAWVGLAIVSTIGYLWVNPFIAVVWVSDGEEEGVAEPGKDDETGNLEDEELDEGEVLVDTEVKDYGATEAQTT